MARQCLAREYTLPFLTLWCKSLYIILEYGEVLRSRDTWKTGPFKRSSDELWTKTWALDRPLAQLVTLALGRARAVPSDPSPMPPDLPLIDAHCHVSGNTRVQDDDDGIQRCLMSTNQTDLKAIRSAKETLGNRVFAGFGVHPWYSHFFVEAGQNAGGNTGKANKLEHYSSVLRGPDSEAIAQQLPEPVPLQQYIYECLGQCQGTGQDTPQWASCIGEIGLDKVFRIPEPEPELLPNDGPRPQARPKTTLSRTRTTMDHQIAIFTSMLDLARAKRLPVSIHSVKCHGKVLEICTKKLLDSSVNVCIHSFTGTLDTVHLWLATFPHERLFFSVSWIINVDKTETGSTNLLKHIPLQCILTETDCCVDVEPLDSQRSMLTRVLEAIAEAHSMSIEDAAATVQRNFARYIGETHS